ncbi:glucokinase, partial [Klebsiella michiganensis]
PRLHALMQRLKNPILTLGIGGFLLGILGVVGVYIAGGIVPRFLEFFKASGFRGGFEDKGRFKAFVQDIPVYLIVHDNPGLLGSGAHLRQTLGQIL